MNNVKKVLVVVDMQNDFVDGALGSAEAKKIVPNVAKKIALAKEEDDTTIIFTKDTHDNDYMATEEGKNLPVAHCIKGESGHELVDEIKEISAGSEHVFEKDTFGSRDLAGFLSDIKPEVIELVGLCTDICVISNAVIAKTSCPNAHIIVDAVCCAGVTPESHDTAISAMKSIQVEVTGQGEEPWRNNEDA